MKKIINILGVLSITMFLFISFTSNDISLAPKPNASSDTICLSCLNDSILTVMKNIIKDSEKIDSISRQVKKKVKKMEENNVEIDVLLEKYEKNIEDLKKANKSLTDKMAVEETQVNKVAADTITTTRNIQVQVKKKSGN